MIVDITDSGVTLTDPEDCRRFHARVPVGVADGAVDAVLAHTGAGRRVGTDQVAVNVAWLRAAAHGVDGTWERSFQQMLDFAGSKGWLTDDGGAVLAHIKRGSPTS
ncbi:hypothetical protein ACVBEQ_03945 [Nakamurella sp. GG22]